MYSKPSASNLGSETCDHSTLSETIQSQNAKKKFFMSAKNSQQNTAIYLYNSAHF